MYIGPWCELPRSFKRKSKHKEKYFNIETNERCKVLQASENHQSFADHQHRYQHKLYSSPSRIEGITNHQHTTSIDELHLQQQQHVHRRLSSCHSSTLGFSNLLMSFSSSTSSPNYYKNKQFNPASFQDNNHLKLFPSTKSHLNNNHIIRRSSAVDSKFPSTSSIRSTGLLSNNPGKSIRHFHSNISGFTSALQTSNNRNKCHDDFILNHNQEPEYTLTNKKNVKIPKQQAIVMRKRLDQVNSMRRIYLVGDQSNRDRARRGAFTIQRNHDTKMFDNDDNGCIAPSHTYCHKTDEEIMNEMFLWLDELTIPNDNTTLKQIK